MSEDLLQLPTDVRRNATRAPVARPVRDARGGTLVLGGGFGGAYVARLLGDRGDPVVSPDSAMLYTPLLPEVAAGAREARHVVVPLRTMCPHAEIVRGRAVGIDPARRRVFVEPPAARSASATRVGRGARRRAAAAGRARARRARPAVQALDDALRLRTTCCASSACGSGVRLAERHLTFVFVGAGYAGVEALAELHQLVRDALRHYPALRDLPQRWMLVDGGGAKVLSEVPAGLSAYTDRLLRRRGVDIRLGTTITSVDASSVTLSTASGWRPGHWCGPRASPRIRSSPTSGCHSTSAAA